MYSRPGWIPLTPFGFGNNKVCKISKQKNVYSINAYGAAETHMEVSVSADVVNAYCA